jgi:hypothetical protein
MKITKELKRFESSYMLLVKTAMNMRDHASEEAVRSTFQNALDEAMEVWNADHEE